MNKTFPLNNLRSTFSCSKANNNLSKYLKTSTLSDIRGKKLNKCIFSLFYSWYQT